MEPSAVDLYWIPLGAGAHVVRISGRLFESLSAAVQRRRRCDLFHSALEISLQGERSVIEMTPIPDDDGARRGVVGEGAVGSRLAGRFRVFRYEIRRWPSGSIPDVEASVGGPVRLSEDPALAAGILELVPSVPRLVWGRDERRTGEMWNSNSVVSWLLVSGGIDGASLRPPDAGRAPGWDAGVMIARRERDDPAAR